MAALTAYQLQFRQRAKKTIQRRADADRKVRAYARLLAAALGEAGAVADAVTLLNKTYPVDVSPQTGLVKVLTKEVGAQLLGKVLADNPAGDELAGLAQVADANGGQPLAADAGFGEPGAAGGGKLRTARDVVREPPAAEPVGAPEPEETGQ